MKKSVKILFTTLLVGLAVVMTSCGAIAAAMGEAAFLDGKTYSATVNGHSIRLRFSIENIEGMSHYPLYVSEDGVDYSDYEWMLDPGEAVAEAKNILIYYTYVTGEDPVLTLVPSSITPSTLTAEGTGLLTEMIPDGKVFTLIDN